MLRALKELLRSDPILWEIQSAIGPVRLVTVGPKHLVKLLLSMFHEEEGGHQGFTKTLAQVCNNFYFDWIPKIVYVYV